MWLGAFLAMVLMIEGVLSSPDPGVSRVPKVYNAVITSNQNLAPSRAYPVVQPIVHRTAIGYVPPFYYPQIAPGFAGPGVVQLDPGPPRTRPEDTESVETSSNADDSPPKRISRPSTTRRESDETIEDEASSESNEESGSGKRTNKKTAKTDRVPLNFYPNYRSIYYDPYFYPYQAFPPNLATPGTYYVDYPQPPALLPPFSLQPGPFALPPRGRPELTPGKDIDDDSSSRRNEKEKIRKNVRREKVPEASSAPPYSITEKKTS